MTDWLTSNLALRARRDAIDAQKKREQQAEAQRQMRAERTGCECHIKVGYFPRAGCPRGLN